MTSFLRAFFLLTFILKMSDAIAQAPKINYATPQVYYNNTAITPLVPMNTGGAVPIKPATNIDSNLSTPVGLAIDVSGNIYVAESGTTINKVTKIPAGGGTPVYIGSNIYRPFGVALDATGNVYVTNYSNSSVKEIPVGGGAVVTVATGLSGPEGIALDAKNNIYVTCVGNATIKKIPAGGGSAIVLATNTTAYGLAVDSAGNVYYADRSSTIKKIPANGGTVIALGSGFVSTNGVVLDAAGNIYVSDSGSDEVKEIPVGGGPPIIYGNIPDGTPVGIAIDSANHIYLTTHDNQVQEIFFGAFTISPSLPTGLSFDYRTGIISGTPTTTSQATNYTITAYNSSGSSSVNVTISIQPYQLPSISYSSPQAYLTGTAIAPLNPAMAGVATANYGSAEAPLKAGFSSVYGIALDAARNIYATDIGNNTVTKISANDSTIVVLASGFNHPMAVAVDVAGNVYVADSGNNLVKKIPANGGVIITLGSGFTNPTGIAVDAAGNIFVSNSGDNTIREIPAGGGATITLASGFNAPRGVAVDILGNLYIADSGNNAIKKIPVGSNTPMLISNQVQNGAPCGVTVDYSGNVFFTDTVNKTLYEIPKNGNSIVPSANLGFYEPRGVAIDGAGILYVVDAATYGVIRYVPTGGYYINPALPAGLVIDNEYGIISGTPEIASPQTNYTVTAYNSQSKGSASISLQVAINTNLSNLSVSSGTLSPAFSASTINYITTVGVDITSISITPTISDPEATVTVNGVAVNSGSASAPYTLSIGKNVFNVVVTARDGTTTKTYSIIVGRGSSIATLSSLISSKGTLTPSFAAGQTSYADTTKNGDASLTLTPTTTDPSATISINGVAVNSGKASAAIPLVVGSNIITLVVTAQDGVTTDRYTLNVLRPSANAKLSALTVSAGTLSPAFNTNTISYTASLTLPSITLTPTVAVTGATITVNGVTVTSGTASPVIPLNLGKNTITAVVTAQDGSTTKTYTLTVTRVALSTNSNLSSLTPSKGTLTPAFAASTINYTDVVTNGTTSITLTPKTQVTTSTVTINGTAIVSGHASGVIALVVGSNTITTVVTAQDGTTKRTYTVNVIRPSTNAKLSALTISSGTLSPAFNSNISSYTSTVTSATSTIKVTPTVAVTGATIKVNGTAVTSGTPSAAIALSVGSNTITTVVTAQDGVTTDTYTLKVTRPAGLNIPDAEISVQTPVDKPLFDEDVLTVHQGISPNGDGVNDFLVIDGIAAYPDNKLSIMNRNGQLVYEAKGYDNATKVFDGHSNKNGQMQLPGTYFYSLDYTVKGIIKHKTGFLVLKY